MLIVIFYAFTELPVTGYEKLRAERMMRNNRMFQSLGLSTLSNLLSNSNAIKKRVMTRDNSGSSYEPGDDEDRDDEGNEQSVVDKVFILPSFHSYC